MIFKRRKKMEIVETKEGAIAAPESNQDLTSQLLQLATNPNINPNVVEKFIKMNETLEKQQAKRAFNESLVNFKANPPRIVKNIAVSFGNTKYKHATIDSVMRQLDSCLHNYGFALNWRIDCTPDLVDVIAVLRHSSGHEETSRFASAPDSSGGKNKIQAQGSAVTYAKRYTALAVLGLAEQGEDDDGIKAFLKSRIQDDEISVLQELIAESGAKISKICAHFKVGSLSEMSTEQYAACTRMLKTKIKNKG
jgi:hypothetical protein